MAVLLGASADAAHFVGVAHVGWKVIKAFEPTTRSTRVILIFPAAMRGPTIDPGICFFTLPVSKPLSFCRNRA
jgi:hypothetical protein